MGHYHTLTSGALDGGEVGHLGECLAEGSKALEREGAIAKPVAATQGIVSQAVHK